MIQEKCPGCGARRSSINHSEYRLVVAYECGTIEIMGLQRALEAFTPTCMYPMPEWLADALRRTPAVLPEVNCRDCGTVNCGQGERAGNFRVKFDGCPKYTPRDADEADALRLVKFLRAHPRHSVNFSPGRSAKGDATDCFYVYDESFDVVFFGGDITTTCDGAEAKLG